jgi:hypothetical protein
VRVQGEVKIFLLLYHFSHSQGIIVAFVCYNVIVMHKGIFSSCLIPCHLSDLHTLYIYVLVFVFCLFVLNKPFSDSLFCRADNKGTYMIVNYCPINNK